MSRLAAVEKGEYYPTPLSIVEQIASYLALPPGGQRGVIRLLDPCCGEGLALEHLARALGGHAETWGVEISPDRAAQAATRLDLAIAAPFEAVSWNHVKDGVASCVYLNAPYDHGASGRMELDFLKMAMPALVAGGVLVYIIPTTAVSWGMAEYLHQHFQDIRVFRFGDEEGPAGFDAFKQLVVLATRRKESLRSLYVDGAVEAANAFNQAYSETYSYRDGPVKDRTPVALPACAGRPEGTLYALPPARKDARIRRARYTDAEMGDLAANVQAQVEEQLAETLLTSNAELPQPLMPPRTGHIAQIVAAGLTGVIETDGKVFKGRVVKVTEVHPDPEDESKEIALDRYETHVVEVSPTGLTHLSQPQAVADFLQNHVEVFKRYITEHFQPYGNSTEVAEERILDTLSLDKVLPGVAKAGLLPSQRECAVALTRAIRRYGVGHLVAEMGSGKALPLDTPVLTPFGWRSLENIRVGDEVVGASGKPTVVLGVYPQGDMNIYRVTFSDGTSTRSTWDHLWLVNTPLRKWRKQPGRVMTLGEIVESGLKHRNGNRKYHIPIAQAIQFPQSDLPLDPYLLGVLLGDGYLRDHSVSLTSADAGIVDEVRRLLPAGVELVRRPAYNYDIVGVPRGKNFVLSALRGLGLLGKRAEAKFIPDVYKFSDEQSRIALLQGLLDTDGSSSSNRSTIEFTTVSESLAADVIFLVESLGGVATVNTRYPAYTYNGERRTGQLSYRIQVRLPREVSPFRLQRKRETHKPCSKYAPTRAIERVEYAGRQQVQCIKVAAEDGLFVIEHCIVTHNTRVSLAAAELLGAYPALVVCPPHLVDKWAREVRDSVPGAEPHVVERIGELQALREAYKPGQKMVVIISRSHVKLGPGWKPQSTTCRALPKDKDDRRQFIAAAQAYRAAHERLLAALRDGVDGAPIGALRKQAAQARREALGAAIPIPTCPDCGMPLSVETRERFHDKPTHCPCQVESWSNEEAEMKTRPCRGALYQFGGLRRWPLADYVRRKMQRARGGGFFCLFIADEVHEFKAKDSDQGWAFGLLARCIPAVVTLTGTIFGGPASSIFWLLHRTQGSVRADYAFDDETRWVRTYGILETTFKNEEDGYGAYTAKRRRRVSTKEKPGISPGIVRYTLPTCIFASLKDLGVRLPDLHEEFVTFPTTRAMESDLGRLWEFTWSELKDHWPHYTSAWLQWNLARPNSCFRAETIEGYAGADVLERLAVVEDDGLLPKEEWLVNTVKAELAAGRRVVVYVRQTGTRDIRSRLVQVLERASVGGVSILSESINPRKREAWLKRNHANVLITNPRLVQTGLDLVQYSTVVFFEVEYSLYTLWQACRRVWRLGQTQPVKVFYLAYADTLEEKAYFLIGQKVKAAMLLYGESVDSALVEDVGDASLVMSLIKAIEEGERLTLERDAHIFTDTTEVVTESVTGSIVLPSTAICDWQTWLAARGMTLQDVRSRPRRKAMSLPGQLTLF